MCEHPGRGAKDRTSIRQDALREVRPPSPVESPYRILGNARLPIAGEGAEAVRKATELKPDLILLDFSMPNMNGVETASVLKKMLPDVHIILFTRFDDVLGSSLVSAAGVDLVVPKSEGLTGLVKAIQPLMGTAG